MARKASKKPKDPKKRTLPASKKPKSGSQKPKCKLSKAQKAAKLKHLELGMTRKAYLKMVRQKAGRVGAAKFKENLAKKADLDLPTPSKVKHDSKEFRKLQAKWYEKLRKSGFDDLEWTDTKTGHGQNTSYLKKQIPNNLGERMHATDLYYTMCRNWLTHAGPKLKKDRMAFELHAEGKGYREILKMIENFDHRKRSLFYLFQRMKPLVKEMLAWNETDPRGVIKSRNDEALEIEVFANTLWQKPN